MQQFIVRFHRSESGSMALLGASILSVMVLGAGAAIDLSRISSAKTELMQVTRFACESAAVEMSSGKQKREARRSANTLASNSVDESALLKDETTVNLEFIDGDTAVRVSGASRMRLMFGGILGEDRANVSAETICPVVAAPINLDTPVRGCTGDAIILTNATRFSADATTAERITSSRTISVAVLDSNDGLIDRVIVGDGGQPSYTNNNLLRSYSVVIQPIVNSAGAPVVCIPTAPPPTTGAGAPQPGGGTPRSGGACLTGAVSGAAAGRELELDTNGTYRAFITDAANRSGNVAVDNGNGSTASSAASLDGPGIASGSASVGDGSSSACAEIETDDAYGVATGTATGDDTNIDATITNTTDNGSNIVRGVINGSSNSNRANSTSNSSNGNRGNRGSNANNGNRNNFGNRGYQGRRSFLGNSSCEGTC